VPATVRSQPAENSGSNRPRRTGPTRPLFGHASKPRDLYQRRGNSVSKGDGLTWLAIGTRHEEGAPDVETSTVPRVRLRCRRAPTLVVRFAEASASGCPVRSAPPNRSPEKRVDHALAWAVRQPPGPKTDVAWAIQPGGYRAPTRRCRGEVGLSTLRRHRKFSLAYRNGQGSSVRVAGSGEGQLAEAKRATDLPPVRQLPWSSTSDSCRLWLGGSLREWF